VVDEALHFAVEPLFSGADSALTLRDVAAGVVRRAGIDMQEVYGMTLTALRQWILRRIGVMYDVLRLTASKSSATGYADRIARELRWYSSTLDPRDVLGAVAAAPEFDGVQKDRALQKSTIDRAEILLIQEHLDYFFDYLESTASANGCGFPMHQSSETKPLAPASSYTAVEQQVRQFLSKYCRTMTASELCMRAAANV
jgi:hypothetical protein